ncbi:MAG TPA: DUF1080 domain-containing protein [Humisphaera sp.]
MKLKTFAAVALAAAAALSSVSMLARAEDKPAAAAAPAAAAVDLGKPDADGFFDLFNGKDLTGWEGQEGFWSVKDGAITASEEKAKSRQTFLIWKGGNVSDFELRWKYKFVTKEGNSGVQFRSRVLDAKKDPYRVGGYQADCDAGNTYTGIIYEEQGRGILSKRGEKTHMTADAKPKTEPLDKNNDEIKKLIKPSGEWNECVLVAKGGHIVYSINGQVTTDLTDDSGKGAKDGILALQCHAGFTMEIQFKDIKYKPLGEKK